MTHHMCRTCGSALTRTDSYSWECPYCKNTYTDEKVRQESEAMKNALKDHEIEIISNLRRNLYDAVTEEFMSRERIAKVCESIKALLPDDFAASFFYTAVKGTKKDTARSLRTFDAVRDAEYTELIVRFGIKTVSTETNLALMNLIERAYKNTDLEKFEKYATALSYEMSRVDDGTYSTILPRDVFVAYSSKDMDKVEELVEELEKNKLSCFVAARNLRHGSDAVENYQHALEEAMDNCKSVVFVSSLNSRSMDCDAIKYELSYIKKKDIEKAPSKYGQDYTNIPESYKKPRVEYLIQKTQGHNAADAAVNDFFKGYEYALSPSAVAERLIKELAKAPIIPPEPKEKKNNTLIAIILALVVLIGAAVAIVPGMLSSGEGEVTTDENSYLDGENKKINSYLKEAETLANDGNIEAAIAEIEKGLAEYPNSTSLNNKLEEYQKALIAAACAKGEHKFTSMLNMNPTCASDGSKTHTCSACGYSEIEVLPATGNHVYSSTISKQATCGETGTKILTCSTCQESKTESIPATGNHTYKESVTKEPTCGTTGLKSLTCSTCQHTTTQTISATGAHVYTESVTKEPTCTATGTKTLTCSACNGTKTESIPATGVHNYVGGSCSFCGAEPSENSFDDLTFIDNGNGVKIVGYSGSAENLSIPSSIYGKTVNAIGTGAFQNCSTLKTVIVPDTVTKIGFGAFNGCNGLVEITLPFVGMSANATESRWAVFGYIFGDKDLSDDDMDRSTTKYSTSGSTGYTSQSYYSDNTNYMFYFAIPKSIRKVTITNQTKIPEYAFQNCDLIKEIKFTAEISDVGLKSFQKCSALSVCDFSASDSTIINQYAFQNCTSLTTFTVPDGVIKISAYTFDGCTALTTLAIPNTVETISACAFKNCAGLTSITVPNSVTSIGGAAFAGCNGLVEMTLPFVGSNINATEDRWAVFGYIFGDKDPDDNDMDKSTTKYSTSGSAGLTSQSHWSDNTNYMFYYAIPKSIKKVIITNQTTIPAYAFQNCDLIKEITFEKTVTYIDTYAFSNAASLTNIGLSVSADTVIQSYAFANCDSFTEIIIPNGVSELGDYAYSSCDRLKKIEIPNTLISIGNWSFNNCSALTDIAIPNSVEKIGNCAFKNCIGLTSIVVPNSVVKIGGGAFAGCNGLTEMTLPFVGGSANATEARWAVLGYIFGDKNPDETEMENSTTKYSTSSSIGYTSQSYYSSNTNYMFYFMIPQSLRKVKITNQTNIPAYAFQNCDLIREITFTKVVEMIGAQTFENCSSLKTINYAGTQSEWNDIVLGANWNKNANDFEIKYNIQ